MSGMAPTNDMLVGGVVLSAAAEAAAMAISIFIVSIVGTAVVVTGAIIGFPVLRAPVGNHVGSPLGPTVGTRIPPHQLPLRLTHPTIVGATIVQCIIRGTLAIALKG